MPANVIPIFPRGAANTNNGSTGMNQLITAAANDYTGISANYSLIWTADASNGGYLKFIRAKSGGTNVASVARFFLNNGSTPGTAANNMFMGELGLPATTAIATAPTADLEFPVYHWFEAGFRIYVGLATAVAAGWVFSPWGGKF